VPTLSAQAPRGFGNVETWVFDLDNTLYPHHLNLWQQVDDRIRAYVSNFLKVSKDEAFRLQKDYYKRYGTTMRGMMTEHGMSPDDYLDFVHKIDHSPLTPNPALGAALEKLPGRKLILTNGTRKHADAVMQKLDIHHHFEMCSTSPPRTSIRNRCRRSINASSRAMVSTRRKQRCSRIWHAIWKRRTRWA
jgi:putative hydrolase of the HAD superfamily